MLRKLGAVPDTHCSESLCGGNEENKILSVGDKSYVSEYGMELYVPSCFFFVVILRRIRAFCLTPAC